MRTTQTNVSRARQLFRRFNIASFVGAALWLCSHEPAVAQVPATAEIRAFQRAKDAFTDGYFERSERGFAQFVTNYPGSTFLAEATLLQAQSALNLTNAPRAIAIINAALPKAGLIQDQYRYCLGNAYLESGSYVLAAETFAAIPRAMADSSLLLEAGYGEALARYRLGQFPTVVNLLQNPAGTFQRGSRTRSSDKFALRGQMLLAEALFRQELFKQAAETVRNLPDDPLLPEIRWERQYLLCRLLVAERRLPDALVATTNLLSFAAITGGRASLADSYQFQAAILRHLGQLDEAATVYTNNLAASVPPEHRRLSLLNIVELKLAQDKMGEAIATLDSFLARYPDDAASAVALLTRGELLLRSYVASTNRATFDPEAPGPLQSALAQFELLLATNAPGALRGKALLNKGWCLWLEGKVADSATAFAAAVQALPFSEDQAVARFKLADARLAQKDYGSALNNYRAVLKDYESMPAVRMALYDQALYQSLHACVAVGDEPGALHALQALLEHPDNELADRSLFLVGQELTRLAKPRQARERFTEFVEKFPGSPRRAEVELMIARTFAQEQRWKEAISRYDNWLALHPTNELRSRAAFDQAQTYDWAGDKTNALSHFNRFVADYPLERRLAPRAQFWVADYHLRIGHYRDAIGNFQKIVENTDWPLTNITYQARFMAGLSAFSAQLWKDAKGHFTTLLGDESCPSDIAASAIFAYGDTLLQIDLERPIDKYREAKDVFNLILLRYTNSPIVAAAWGRVGDCYLQMASQDPKQYAEATNAYLRVMTNSTADIGLRSQAECGLAKALDNYGATLTPAERSAFQKAAFDHYYTVVIGENLRDGESPDAAWLEKAGTEAARIAEGQQQWTIAISIYQRMQKLLPPIQVRMAERIRRVQEIMRRDVRG